jgi:nucleoside triphosphate diphosphatase
MEKQPDTESISRLLEIMARLRDPDRGCPWDREQTFATIAPYTIEEAYEVAEAIANGAGEPLADELGDLLFQVVFHARIAEEAGAFDFADVVARICAKLERRHPHVFGDAVVADAAGQTEIWETIKAEERRGDDRDAGVLGGVPLALPALIRAAKLGRRAARVGFDWPDRDGVRAKVDEELAELDAALASAARDAAEAELGDVLFAIANLSRHLELDPEACLRAANARFERRFGHVEVRVGERGGDWSAIDLATLERFLGEAKARERGGGD